MKKWKVSKNIFKEERRQSLTLFYLGLGYNIYVYIFLYIFPRYVQLFQWKRVDVDSVQLLCRDSPLGIESRSPVKDVFISLLHPVKGIKQAARTVVQSPT